MDMLSTVNIEILTEKVNETIRELLQELIENTPDTLKAYSQEFAKFTLRPGKRIRPLLLLLTYYGYKNSAGDDADRSAYTLAGILEIMHSFLLVHDDVIDQSSLRRGEPTLHKIYEQITNDEKMGKDLAIIVGDIVSFYYFGKLADMNAGSGNELLPKILRLFADCYVKTGYGQLLDILFTGRMSRDAMVDDVPTKISLLKTAYYTFVYPMLFGYYLAGGVDGEEAEKLRVIGEKVGIAFQYRDDILGTFGGEAKSANDIAEGKTTILVKRTFDKLSESEKQRFLELMNKKQKSEDDIETVKSYMLKSGALSEIIEDIRSLVEQALSMLAPLQMKTHFKKQMEKIFEKVLDLPKTF
ncbi:geranylgeranyl diphosphate synthase, type I [Fervidobacterium changbaicum]|nr:geranylgeranyl diphosphate synthase, type I [Fervidobacterium changbaicum]